MDAIFFSCLKAAATGVASSDDLPSEPVTDPLQVADPSPLVDLAHLLAIEPPPRPLRDATCRSFPVWSLGRSLAARIGSLDDEEIDALAEAWRKQSGSSLDADLYELSSCLTDLRTAVRLSESGESGESLFVLLEERAW
jgi:hypothetical protein